MAEQTWDKPASNPVVSANFRIESIVLSGRMSLRRPFFAVYHFSVFNWAAVFGPQRAAGHSFCRMVT